MTGQTLQVQPPGKPAIAVLLPPLVVTTVEATLAKAASGPLLFAGETAGPHAIDSVLWLDAAHTTNVKRAVGKPAQTLQQIDAIAIAKRLDGPKKTCTGYRGDKGAPAPDIELELKPTEVAVFARRTGQLITRQVFAAKDECPTYASGGAKQILVRESPVPTEEIATWLTAQTTAAPPPAAPAPAAPAAPAAE